MISWDSMLPGNCKVLNRLELVEFVTDGAGTPRICDLDRERRSVVGTSGSEGEVLPIQGMDVFLPRPNSTHLHRG